MVYTVSAKTLTAKVLIFLYENPGSSIKDVSQALGISLATIRGIVYRLKNSGYIDKAGGGYVLTDKGEWFVSNILSKDRGKPRPSRVSEKAEARVEADSEKTESISSEIASTEEEAVRGTRDEELKSLVDRVISLEKEVRSIRSALNRLSRELEELKKEVITKEQRAEKSSHENSLPKPVMNFREAVDVLGYSSFEELRLEGKIEIVGSLVVDKEFYEEFKKKFPIPLSEVGKLSTAERRLLEEMIRDARVIVRAGREYRLA